MNFDALIKQYRGLGLKDKDLKQLKSASKQCPTTFRRYAERVLFGEPIEYVLEKVNFYKNTFYIDRRVYIPNKETEFLVKVAVKEIPRDTCVLEVGTGCGAVAITLKKERPDLTVFACDIDKSALKVAKKNILQHKLKIPVFESFYCDDLKLPRTPEYIVADLPWGKPQKKYILHKEGMQKLSNMPPISLFNPRGKLASQQELLASVERSGLGVKKLWMETGKINKLEVKETIPSCKKWTYYSWKGYSVTEVNL